MVPSSDTYTILINHKYSWSNGFCFLLFLEKPHCHSSKCCCRNVCVTCSPVVVARFAKGAKPNRLQHKKFCWLSTSLILLKVHAFNASEWRLIGWNFSVLIYCQGRASSYWLQAQKQVSSPFTSKIQGWSRSQAAFTHVNSSWKRILL